MFKTKQLTNVEDGLAALHICNELLNSLVDLNSNWDQAFSDNHPYNLFDVIDGELKELFEKSDIKKEILNSLDSIEHFHERFTITGIRMIAKREVNHSYGFGIKISFGTKKFIDKSQLRRPFPLPPVDLDGNILAEDANVFHLVINRSTMGNAIYMEEKSLAAAISTDNNSILNNGFSNFRTNKHTYDLAGRRYKVVAIDQA